MWPAFPGGELLVGVLRSSPGCRAALSLLGFSRAAPCLGIHVTIAIHLAFFYAMTWFQYKVMHWRRILYHKQWINWEESAIYLECTKPIRLLYVS